MVNPIFILGLNRNGTTWIQNILLNHPEIVGAHHKAHWGVVESHICRNNLYWGDFEENDRFIRFLELYSCGDHFKLVDGDKEYFYKERPENFTQFFFEMMDKYAEKKDAKYWITKLDKTFYLKPYLLEKFLDRAKSRYEEIKIIGIKRNYNDVLMSALNMPGKKKGKRKKLFRREIFCLKHIIFYAIRYNSIEKILSEHDGLMLSFSTLLDNRDKITTQIVEYLGLKTSDKMLEDKYPANSSYREKNKIIKIPDWEMKMITNSLLPIFEKKEVSHIIKNIIIKLQSKFDYSFEEIRLTFRLLKLEKLEESFKNELDERELIGLKKVLFEEDKIN